MQSKSFLFILASHEFNLHRVWNTPSARPRALMQPRTNGVPMKDGLMVKNEIDTETTYTEVWSLHLLFFLF